MQRFIWIFFLALLLGYPPCAKAALWDRGGGLIYDDVLDVTWLQDANLPLTLGYSLDGRMYWDEAKTWVANLAYYDEVRDIVWTNWRLPNILPQNGSEYDFNYANDGSTDKGTNITSIQSELAYMYYVNLGNIGVWDVNGNPQTGSGLVNTEPFIGLVEYSYWSGQEHYPDTYIPLGLDPGVWSFAMQIGAQDAAGLSWRCYVWPVMEGDAGVIPIPDAVITMTSPNGGEELSAGETYEVIWSSSGDIDFVNIEYSINYGTDWVEIALNAENDRSFLWEVPSHSSDECLLRISDVDGDPLDVSDGVFTITIPPCKGDFNDDGYVDEDDLSIFAFAFGTTDCNWRPPYCYWWPVLCNWWPPTCECDFDGDDDVDGSDHAVFVKDFGRIDCP